MRPTLGYLSRLKRRMVECSFRPDDPLLIAVCKAEAGIHELHITTHYLSCGNVVGRQSPQPSDQAERNRNQGHGEQQGS